MVSCALETSYFWRSFGGTCCSPFGRFISIDTHQERFLTLLQRYFCSGCIFLLWNRFSCTRYFTILTETACIFGEMWYSLFGRFLSIDTDTEIFMTLLQRFVSWKCVFTLQNCFVCTCYFTILTQSVRIFAEKHDFSGSSRARNRPTTKIFQRGCRYYHRVHDPQISRKTK